MVYIIQVKLLYKTIYYGIILHSSRIIIIPCFYLFMIVSLFGRIWRHHSYHWHCKQQQEPLYSHGDAVSPSLILYTATMIVDTELAAIVPQ